MPAAPSGFIAGIYARTDVARGVHKAPANEVIRSIRGFESAISKREQDILNPQNINVLRDFPGRGNRCGERACSPPTPRGATSPSAACSS